MTTATFIKFPRNKIFYALGQMQKAHQFLSICDGISFYKLMGSGAGSGFSIWPNFSVYCLLVEWQNEQSRKRFFETNESWKTYTGASMEFFTIEMQAQQIKGTWGGRSPFKISSQENLLGPIVVLTRASIKKRWIPYFWSQVPKASAPVDKKIGHLFSKGVGEVPLLHQATISIWNSKEDMVNYAYKDPAHLAMISKTKSKGWYKEEMFAEFKLLHVSGVWNGKEAYNLLMSG